MIQTLGSVKIKKAYKPHRCHDCLRAIQRGEAYTRYTLKDGVHGPYHWNTCGFCEEWIAHMPDSWRNYGEDLGPGWVNEAIDAHAYDPKTKTYGVET